ncbi:MAG: LLM class flavin-dependent oxidoreductase, partial [Acidimicrobiia bacterium]
RDPSAPFTWLSAVAARTERLRLGTAIWIAGLHHPVSTYEQVTPLDQVSGGRAILGVGAGYRAYEFEGLGVEFERRGRRLDETLEILRGAWATGRHGYKGEVFTIPDLPVHPPAVQRPRPPILVGGTSPAAIRRAARLGDGWFTLPMETLPVVRDLADRYRAECAAAGTTPYICLMRQAWVAPTLADVDREWLDKVQRFHRYYWETGTRGDDRDPVLRRVGEGERVDLETFVRDRAIAGTPELCAQELRRWHEAIGFDEVCLIFLAKPVPQPELDRSVRLFAEEVVTRYDEPAAL